MVVIRLARAGAHKKPFYHLVVTDRRNARDGRFIERLGYYNPSPAENGIYIHMDLERVKHWVSQGAQPSERVACLIEKFEKNGGTSKPAKVKKVKVAASKPAETENQEAAA